MRIAQRHGVGWLLVVLLTATAAAQDAREPAESKSASNWLRKLSRFHLPDEHHRSHPQVKDAFRSVVRAARKSTVRVVKDDVQLALGAIVDQRGYIVTKASEVDGKVECQLADGRRFPARVVAQHPDFDLAVLKIDAPNLTEVQWADSPPLVGAWLATPGMSFRPTAIGVVSNLERNIPARRAVLGVHLGSSDAGPRIEKVIPESAAAEAKLKVGDVITEVDGSVVETPHDVSSTIQQFRPGDRVVLQVQRDDEELSVTAVLTDLLRLVNEQVGIMDRLGGPLSKRRHGFPAAIQHDSVLRPRDCGGPLVDLTGKVVGINIARASRVASYAVPAETLQALLPSLMSNELAETHTAAAEPQVGSE